MKKNIILFIFLSIVQISTLSFADVGKQNFKKAVYLELSSKYYPKTVQYFAELGEKYPDLKSIPILILAGPQADEDTIYFPKVWIEELEKGNTFYKDATEWIVLHECGHIKHRDVLKRSLGSMGTNCVLLPLAMLGVQKLANKLNIKDGAQKTLLYAKGFGVAIGAGLAANFYMIRKQEYAADDYAMKHCNNPKAWIAAYEWFDINAPLGLYPYWTHSCTKQRLVEMEKQFKAKFGYELEVIPQSLNPQYA